MMGDQSTYNFTRVNFQARLLFLLFYSVSKEAVIFPSESRLGTRRDLLAFTVASQFMASVRGCRQTWFSRARPRP